MVKKGVGAPQIDQAKESKETILKVLTDREWHRYNEIVENTKLSTATVSKHLKELEKSLVEKRVDIDTGEYPYPTYYRWRPTLPLIDDGLQQRLNDYLKDYSKSPRLYINFMNQIIGVFILEGIETYLTKGGPDNFFDEYLENYIMGRYRQYLFNLKDSFNESIKKGNRVELIKILENDKHDYVKNEVTGVLKEIILGDKKQTLTQNLKALFYIRHPKDAPEKV